MRRALLPILILLQLLAFPGAGAAQTVTADVDTATVALGHSLTLTVTVEGGSGEVNHGLITDFKVISRGTSTNYQYINGQSRHTVTYTYTLIPLKKGRLTIPSLPVEIRGKKVRTNEIHITVTDPGQAEAPRAEQEIFVEAGISKQSAYVGEQLIYTFRLYRTVNINNIRFQRPDFKGFTAEQIGEEGSSQRVISGRRFHVTELSYVLLPLEPGPITIEPAALQCDVIRQDRRRTLGFFFDNSFRGESQVLQTQPQTVEVLPLPSYNGDAPFSGLVGRFSMSAEMEKSTLETGGSATLSLTINGNGNIMDAGAPEFHVPDSFKVYKDAAEEEIALDREGYFGKKTFRTALVPVEPGEYRIDPIRVSYFDTRSQTYQTLSSQTFSLSVSPSAQTETLAVYSASEPGTGTDRKAVAFTGRDILPLKEDLDALEPKRPLPMHHFALFLLCPALLFAGAWTYGRIRHKSDEPAILMTKKSRKALQEAGKADLSQENFLANLHRALTAAICARTRICREAITADEAGDLLQETGYPEPETRKIAQTLARIESARFSGQDLDEARKSLLSETREEIKGLLR